MEISELLGVKEEIITEPLFVFEEDTSMLKGGDSTERVKGKLVFRRGLKNTGKLKSAGMEDLLCDYICRE